MIQKNKLHILYIHLTYSHNIEHIFLLFFSWGSFVSKNGKIVDTANILAKITIVNGFKSLIREKSRV